MKELGHLQVYDLILKTRTPLFVGSGKKYVKKEYLFDPKGRRASFLKEDAFFQLLTDRNLEERYEQFMRGEQDNLHAFLTRDCQLRPEEVRSVIRYSVDASDAEVVKDKKREIHGFIRNAAGQQRQRRHSYGVALGKNTGRVARDRHGAAEAGVGIAQEGERDSGRAVSQPAGVENQRRKGDG